MVGVEGGDGRSPPTDSRAACVAGRRADCRPNYSRDLEGANSSCPPYAAPPPVAAAHRRRLACLRRLAVLRQPRESVLGDSA